VSGETLEVLPDKDLQALVKQENYVVALFTDKEDKSSKAADLETELAAVREQLVDSLNAWVVRAQEDSAIKSSLVGDQHKGPAVVFFRKVLAALPFN